jgi:hypothetical protein
MKALYNLILDTSGFIPQVPAEELKPVCGAAWYNFITVPAWAKGGRTWTTDEAIEFLQAAEARK